MDARVAELMDVFRKNYLVSGLPDVAVDEIAELAKFRAAIAGETLIEKGDKSADLYVILDGRVNLYGPDGDKIVEIGPPSLLGEIALVDNLERTITAVAVGLVKCAVLPGNELRRYMSGKKDYGFIMLSNLARVLSMRLRNTNVQLLNFMEKSQDGWKHVT